MENNNAINVVCIGCGVVHTFASREEFADRLDKNGQFVCEECEDDGWCICPDCERWTDSGLITINEGHRDSFLCCFNCAEDNYYLCDDCGDYFTADNISTDDCGHCICDDCLHDHYHICYDCGRIVDDDETFWNDGDALCEYCYDSRCEDDNSSPLMLSYHSSRIPATIFMDDFGNASRYPLNDELTFGLELETSGPGDLNDYLMDVIEITDRLYPMEDGSINYPVGCEWVSQPGTIGHLINLPWEKIQSVANRYHYTSHDNGHCGLHIHVGNLSGRTRSEAEWREIVMKIILLMERHKDTLHRLSRRNGENRYAMFLHTDASCLTTEVLKADGDVRSADRAYQYCQSDGRYQWLNLCDCRTNTIEFRLYRGSLRPSTIRATLELTNAIVKFAKSHTRMECATSEFEQLMNGCVYLPAYVEERGGKLPEKNIIVEREIYGCYENDKKVTKFEIESSPRLRFGNVFPGFDLMGVEVPGAIDHDFVGLVIPGYSGGHCLDGILDHIPEFNRSGWWVGTYRENEVDISEVVDRVPGFTAACMRQPRLLNIDIARVYNELTHPELFESNDQ